MVKGGPSSGKTTTVNILKSRGYKTTIKDARHYIDLQVQQKSYLDPNEMVFLDRAIPDSLAYYRFTGLEPTEKLLKAIASCSYKTVFLHDNL